MEDMAVHGVRNQYFYYFSCLHKSSLPEVFCEKAVLKKFAKCTAKHLCQILSFNKVCNSDLTSTQGTSIPINFNTPISSFNRSIVEFEDNIDLQTEKAFFNNNT